MVTERTSGQFNKSGSFQDQGSQSGKERMNNHTARDLDDSAHHFPELYTDADFVRDRMNFQCTQASFVVMALHPLHP